MRQNRTLIIKLQLIIMRDLLNKIVDVNIVSQIGSKHQSQDFFYPVNYGKLVINEKIGAYVLGHYNSLKTFRGLVVAIIEREENSELIVAVADLDNTYTFKQIRALVEFQERF